MGIRKNICPVTHSGIPYIPRKNPFFSTSFHFQQAYPVLYPSYLNEIGVIWKEEGGGRGRKDSATYSCNGGNTPDAVSSQPISRNRILVIRPMGSRREHVFLFLFFFFFGDVRKWMLHSWLFSFPESHSRGCLNPTSNFVPDRKEN